MPWVAWALLPVLGVLFTLQVQARSDRRDEQLRHELYRDLCAAVVPLDNEFRRAPPTSPIGKELAVAYARMRVTLECDKPT